MTCSFHKDLHQLLVKPAKSANCEKYQLENLSKNTKYKSWKTSYISRFK